MEKAWNILQALCTFGGLCDEEEYSSICQNRYSSRCQMAPSAHYAKGITGKEVAKDISEGLARNALSIKIDGEVWDLDRKIDQIRVGRDSYLAR